MIRNKEKGDMIETFNLRKNEMGRAITQDIPYALDLPTYFHFSHSESKKASLSAIPFMFRTKHVNEDGRSKSHVPNLAESLHSETKAHRQ